MSDVFSFQDADIRLPVYVCILPEFPRLFENAIGRIVRRNRSLFRILHEKREKKQPLRNGFAQRLCLERGYGCGFILYPEKRDPDQEFCARYSW